MGSPVKFNRIYSGLLTAAMWLAVECLAASAATVYWKGASSNTPDQTPTNYHANSWWSAGWTFDPTGNDVHLYPDYLDRSIGSPQAIYVGTFYKTYINANYNIVKPGDTDAINSLNVQGSGWVLKFRGSSPVGGTIKNGGLYVRADAIIGNRAPGGLAVSGLGGIPVGSASNPTGYAAMYVLGKLVVGQIPAHDLVPVQPTSTLSIKDKAGLYVRGQVAVGNQSAGLLNVNGDSTLSVEDNISLGVAPGIKGTARIGHDGVQGSFFGSHRSITVGYQGIGVLDVKHAGTVYAAGQLVAGVLPNSRGVLFADGMDTYIAAPTMVIGKQGTGKLHLSGGAFAGATVGSLIVGELSGSLGTVNVRGSNSRAYSAGRMQIINGSVNLLDFGRIQSPAQVEVGARGKLTGLGTVYSPVTNAGRIETSTFTTPTAAWPYGSITVVGNYSQTTGALALNLNTPNPTSGRSLLYSTGVATLGGALKVTYTGDSLGSVSATTPPTGSAYTLVQANQGVIGRFTSVTLPTFSDAMWALEYKSNSVDLRLLVPGDYNHDLVVNTADVTLWQSMSGLRGLGLAADGNWDRVVDSKDLDLVTKYFGRFAQRIELRPASAISAVAVPEPSTGALVGLALLCARRRRRGTCAPRATTTGISTAKRRPV